MQCVDLSRRRLARHRLVRNQPEGESPPKLVVQNSGIASVTGAETQLMREAIPHEQLAWHNSNPDLKNPPRRVIRHWPAQNPHPSESNPAKTRWLRRNTHFAITVGLASQVLVFIGKPEPVHSVGSNPSNW